MNKARIEKVQRGIALATTIYAHGKSLHNWYQSRDLYVATVEEGAYGYSELMKWLNERITGKRYRFLVDRYGVDRYLDAKEAIPIEIDGHKLTVSVGGGAEANGDMMSAVVNSPVAMNRQEVLTFTSHGMDGIIALERLLDEMRNREKNCKKDNFLYAVSTFGWDGDPLPKRSIDSVFLPEGAREALVADMKNFLGSAEHYDTVGIPWHRGYMLHGEPGNGKTSLTLALANELNMSLYTLNLSAVSSDRSLASSINDINDNSILLIEDIDIFSDSVSRDAKKDSPTLAGMLNALDGVSTPRGLLTFITTNHVESLDPALVRPGRIDYKLELKAPDAYQIRSMYRHVFNQELDVEPRKFESMADLTNVFKMNLGDPEAVRLEIKGN